MRYILLLSFSIISCSQQVQKDKKYIIEIDTKQLSIAGDRLENVIKTDTVEVANDSAAYIEGANTFIAHIRTHELLKERGIKWSTMPKSFEVKDEHSNNIKYALSDSFRKMVEDYAHSNGDKKPNLIDSIWMVEIEKREKRKKHK